MRHESSFTMKVLQIVEILAFLVVELAVAQKKYVSATILWVEMISPFATHLS